MTVKIVQRGDFLRSDGTAALGLQVIIDRRKKVFGLKVWVKPSEFDASKPAVRLGRVGEEWRKLEASYNAIVLGALSRALNILAEAQAQQRPLSIEGFSERYSNSKLDKDFLVFMAAAIDKERGLLAQGTTADNLKVLHRLQQFRAEIPFHQLTTDLVKELHKHLQQKKLGPNTIASTHKGFRKFILLAGQQFPSVKNPYVGFRIAWAEQERSFLTPAELAEVLQAYRTRGVEGAELSPALRRACRCFLFQCFTGLRVGDAKRLGVDNVVGDHLVFVAEKTKRVKLQTRVKLNRISKGLMEDARVELGRKHKENLLGFYEDDGVYNRALGNLSSFLGLGKRITSHVGRHTFATNYLLASGKVERLMRLLGHSKLETTMIYVHLVEEFVDMDMEAYAKAFDLGAVTT